MDNTELHYITYDPDAIWEEMIQNYTGAGGDILYPGDEKEMLLRSVQADIVQVLAGVDNALRMQTLRYAVGDYLDIIGEQRGCNRFKAGTATAVVLITANDSVDSVTIPAGTTMTADGVMFYALVSDVTLTSALRSVAADIVCTTEGSAGNALVADTEMWFVTGNRAISNIIVTTTASGGSNAEEDDAYRERIREYMLASVTTGPARQYESIARSVVDVIDAKALPGTVQTIGRDDPGVVYMFLHIVHHGSADADSEILLNVSRALNAESARPLTDIVNVDLAAPKEFALNLVIEYDGNSAILDAVEAAVEEYQEWQCNTIGRAFNPERLIALAYQAGASHAYFGSGSTFDDSSTIEYTNIAVTEICTGTVTVTVSE